MIFVSTGGNRALAASEYVRSLLAVGLRNFELSGGRYKHDQLKNLVNLSTHANFEIHNYFPPPENPFVFNLASADPVIESKSVEHALTAMSWAETLGTLRYSFHAGFLVDPKVEELGRRVAVKPLADRQLALEKFISNVCYLAQEAEKKGIDLLIENNVVSLNNYKNFGGNPFLMTTPDECIYVMEHTPANVRLLVDVAHLKVSANTLEYDPLEFLSASNEWVGAYHLSDNDGFSDNNERLTKSAWFWEFIRKDLHYYSVEVYGLTPDELYDQYLLVQGCLDE